MSSVLEELRAREAESLHDLGAIAQKCGGTEFGVSGGYGVRAHVSHEHQRSTFDLDFVVLRENAGVLMDAIRGIGYNRVKGKVMKRRGFSVQFQRKTPHGVVRADVSVDDVYDRYRTKLRYPLTREVMQDIEIKPIVGIFAAEARVLIPALCAEDLLILKALPSCPADQVDICCLLADVELNLGRFKRKLRSAEIARGFQSGMKLLERALSSGTLEKEVRQKIGGLTRTSWGRVNHQLKKLLA